MKLNGDKKKIEDLDRNIKAAIQYMLDKISQNVLVNNAKINAPFRSGDLRTSIGRDTSQLESNLTVIVGSPLSYSKLREFINNLHPNTKYYLWRAYSEHIGDIHKEMITALSDKL